MLTKNGTLKKIRRYVCLGLMITLIPMMMSCYGAFPLTHTVYRLNDQAGNGVQNPTGSKVVKSVVFWILVIIPVYKVAMLADAIVLNLIEFWSGTTITISSVQEQDGTKVALQPSEDGREAILTVTQEGKLITEQHVIKVSDTVFEMRDATGTLNGKIIKTSEGGIQLTNANGDIVRTLAAEDLAEL